MNERLYLRSPSINVCFRAIIAGTFDKKNIGQALEKVCIRHPLLNCSIERDNDNNTWFVKNSSIEIEYYKSNEIDWKTWYKKTDNVPFNFSKGPLVKFCIIVGNNTEIIILGHHIIGDGVGYLNLVRDALLALDNKIDTTPQIPPSEPADRYFKKTILLDTQIKSYANWACGINTTYFWRNSACVLQFFKNKRNRERYFLHSPECGGSLVVDRTAQNPPLKSR
jgi:hypothetical protein